MTARLLSVFWWVLLASIFVLGVPYQSYGALSWSLNDQTVTSSRVDTIGPGQRSEAELKAAVAEQPSDLSHICSWPASTMHQGGGTRRSEFCVRHCVCMRILEQSSKRC